MMKTTKFQGKHHEQARLIEVSGQRRTAFRNSHGTRRPPPPPPPATSTSPNPDFSPNLVCATCNSGGGGGGTAPPSATWKLSHFHKDHATKTYTFQLQNGFTAAFDFTLDEITISYGGTQAQYPLNSVILQAANNDPQAAAALYNEMYQSISVPYSDEASSLMSQGTNNNAFDSSQFLSGKGQINQPFSSPSQCDPIPDPCAGNTSYWNSWGIYDNWWDTPLTGGGSGGGPSPGGCAPNDIQCILWQHDQQDACGKVPWDQADVLSADAVLFMGCVAGGEISFGMLCGVAGYNYLRSLYSLGKDTKKCHEPYPY